ncbi:hypothetical protein P4259_28480 [Bacillus thuringiensis]|nr:hypothetical protein [Bacillus thuringiensis]
MTTTLPILLFPAGNALVNPFTVTVSLTPPPPFEIGATLPLFASTAGLNGSLNDVKMILAASALSL